MHTPLIPVVIPSYNAERYIAAPIKLVLTRQRTAPSGNYRATVTGRAMSRCGGAHHNAARAAVRS